MYVCICEGKKESRKGEGKWLTERREKKGTEKKKERKDNYEFSYIWRRENGSKEEENKKKRKEV